MIKNSFGTTLPVGICIYALVNRKINQIKLYIYLKSIASGHIKYSNTIYDYKKEWAKALNCHPKTIKSSIDWLIKNNWITINSKRQSLRIVSYKQVCTKNKLDKKIAAIYEPENFDSFRAFCIATVITYFRNRKKWNDKRSVSNKRKFDARKSRYAYPRGFYPLPNLYLAKCLNISKTAAHKYKMEAIEYGFISRKKQISYIYSGKEKLMKEAKNAYAKGSLDKDLARRLRAGKKYLKVIESDAIKSEIILKRKRFALNKRHGKKVNG